MFRSRTAIEYPDRTLTAFRPSIARTDLTPLDVSLIRLAVERAIDAVIEDSFPASDPPSWNPGTARPAPASDNTTRRVLDETGADVRQAGVAGNGVIDVSRSMHSGRPFVHALISLAGAGGVALLLGFVILLITAPVALFVGGLIEAIGWLVNLSSRGVLMFA